jgi:hypothetical protein
MPLQSQPTDNDDAPNAIVQFLTQSSNLCNHAQFVVDSLPNADLPAVKRQISLLEAIRHVLESMGDDDIPHHLMDPMYRRLDGLLAPLRTFSRNPPAAHNQGTTHNRTGAQGRPRVELDMEKILELRDLGASWNAIAKAVGVTRQTLYNRMREQGLNTSRPKFTEVDDELLDEMVSQITLDHPFMGIKMVQGHLKARHINLPYRRIQDCMHRVDLIGTLIRWAHIYINLLSSKYTGE